MIVRIKTSAGDNFEVEIEAEETVVSLKALACSLRPDWDFDRMEVVHKGKVLRNEEATLSSAGVVENDVFVVTKYQQKSADAAPAAEAQPVPAQVPAEAPSGYAAPTPGAAPMSSSSANQDQQAQMMALIQQMGQALAASGQAPGGAAPGSIPTIPGQVPGAVPGGMGSPAVAMPEPTGPLADLQKSPQWPMLCAHVQADPGKFQNVFHHIIEKAPHFVQPILENHDEFCRLLEMKTVAPPPGALQRPRRPPAPQLTAAEQQAIMRLTELGFSKQAATEAYLACDKNEEVAANFLFEHME
jgi:UV excision repair protein RAD23